MKIRIDTCEVTDEQAVINGQKLRAKDLREVLTLAVEELVKGRRVSLSELQVRLEMMSFLTTPQAREHALRLLLSSQEGKEEALRFLQTPHPEPVGDPDPGHPIDEDQLAEADHCDGSGSIPGELDGPGFDCPGCPACDPLAADPNDDPPFAIPASRVPSPPATDDDMMCLRCSHFMEAEEPGRCEGCGGRIHSQCRAADVGDAVEHFGPLPFELRGGVGKDGETVAAPVLCADCIRLKLEELDVDEDIGHEASE